MTILKACEFDGYWKTASPGDPAGNALAGSAASKDAASKDAAVREIIEAVRREGDAALRRYAARFDRCSPPRLEVPAGTALSAWKELRAKDRELAGALELAARHIRRFAEEQKKQFTPFELEMEPGLFTGQRVIPVETAAVYVPAGRFPLFSSVLMGMIPAMIAGVDTVILASPPMEDGLPGRHILAAAALSWECAGAAGPFPRIFAAGGAQAIAALALGTESVPRADLIVGPGNKYVAAAKRMLFGEVGIDFVAGPTDVLVIADPGAADPGAAGFGTEFAGISPAELIAADMLAQAEHDPDARARALTPDPSMAEEIVRALERRLERLPPESRSTAGASLDAGGLIIVYDSKEEAIRVANIIAPEHLELQVEDPESWITGSPCLRNYGSLFLGPLSAEALGDYTAGINHTLPTSGSARFSGGLSVRHFLKTLTTLRCLPRGGFDEARGAAEILGRAEGLAAHAESAAIRGGPR
ncbi:MAG: histidinol dehydrogenase [Treponema sp.]|jgi:histidinol dehydrogenase|nr:histidinol dehydrogenase [Treponema sp.]